MSDAGPESVKELVEMFYESLYRYAFRLSGSAADAEDLAQEAFCKAQAQFKQLRDRNRAKPWLFSIVRNLYLHKLRIAKQFVTLSLDAVAELPENVPDTLPEIDSEQLQQALGELPEVFRTPIILYYFEDFSYRDIAEQMDLPIGTVMSRLARAKGFLRQKLFPELSSRPHGAHDGAANDTSINDGAR
jgi:RNA polymerase sigma-70 factor (ECF subfamily)